MNANSTMVRRLGASRSYPLPQRPTSRPPSEAASTATGGACSQSAQAALRACRSQAQSNRSLAIGTCTNLSDVGDRSPCLHRADTAFNEARSLCDAQLNGCQELCEALGSGPYDPAIRPADFTSRIDNAYLPLVPGTLVSDRDA
jgi:hypothetical protein